MRSLLTLLFCFRVIFLSASYGDYKSIAPHFEKGFEYKQNCARSISQTDLDINNVRARLLIGGDFGWDGNQAKHIVPNLGPGQPEVSSLYVGGIWLGGFDPIGNLKIAAQQYGFAAGKSDFWPGPLTNGGDTDVETCENWDRFFTVTSADIDAHILNYRQSQKENTNYNKELIPESIKEWPGLGNEFFFDRFGFHLPTNGQGLASFWDENGDGLYTPQFGDYPTISVRGCGSPMYADQMTFYIFNDAGNWHSESGGDAMQMEVQVQAYAFATNDALNDMTFSQYKLINRSHQSINDTYFGVWLDPDLGCSEDDFIGCDTIRDLMYIYNSDAIDGNSNGDCLGGVPTYGDEIPYLGVDFFKGLRAWRVFGENGDLSIPEEGQMGDTIIDLGMTSFIYNIDPSAAEPIYMVSPATSQGYYNYLSGVWRTGIPMTIGGNGFGGTLDTKYAFFDEPNNEDGWSMCSVGLPTENMKTIQASGPFRLNPGQMNEVIIGIPWVPDVVYPCPDLGRLFKADDLAQSLFDNCFNIGFDGPDAPDLSWILRDQKVIGMLTNDEVSSNNNRESYSERYPLSPPGLLYEESLYKFEGYIVFQLLDENVTQDDLGNTEKAKIVFQSDRKNEAEDIFNWVSGRNPNAGPFEDSNVFSPILKVEGENEGVKTSFEITHDLFTNESLINYKTYYYMAIAYAHNEYAPFDPITQRGQDTPYIEGHRNVKVYSVIPRAFIEEENERLNQITVFPNPNAVSEVGNNYFSNLVQIANLPQNSEVSIYTKDGKLVRQFQVKEDLQTSQQPTLEWNLKNTAGMSVPSGLYFIHVLSEGLGEKVLKLSVVN